MGLQFQEVGFQWKSERHKKYNNSDKGKARKNSYRGRKSLDNYLTKPFRAWDGEGWTLEDEIQQRYVMLASSEGHVLENPEGIGTKEAFEFLLNTDQESHINIIFAGNYDVNMILKDVNEVSLRNLWIEGSTWWEGYKIEWRPNKEFYIRHKDGRHFRLYDVFSFFQCKFTKACDEYLGNDWPHRDVVIQEKSNRGSFDPSDSARILQYCKYELENLVSLTNELRTRLHRVDIRVSKWYGPGAIATCLYQKHETKSFMGTIPEEVALAGRYAYAGGRFEIIRFGHSRMGAYDYDINSAYPSAITKLPCLAHGRWIHRSNPTSIVRFGVYRIEITKGLERDWRPQPLWMRGKEGTITYYPEVHNWFWSPEAENIATYYPYDSRVTIHEGWEWVQECDHEPFSWVEAMYNKRQALKKAGDGAQMGLKLGLNSLYGKMAQQLGWKMTDKGLHIPPFHCLEWAGYVTSHCRAKVWRAAMLAPDDVIAFETDGVFTRVPLDLPLGEGLGEWDETRFDDLTYIQSGIYFATRNGEDMSRRNVFKSRGFNPAKVKRQTAIRAMREGSYFQVRDTHFIGLGAALMKPDGLTTVWRSWQTTTDKRRGTPEGKRLPSYTFETDKKDGWNETCPRWMDQEFSYEYPVEWLRQEIANEDRWIEARRLGEEND